jgi:hypothetical protein
LQDKSAFNSSKSSTISGVTLFSLEIFDALHPIFEVGKGFCVYHQFCCEILKAFLAHSYHVQFSEVFKIMGTIEAEGVLLFAEYNRLGGPVSNMSADNPDGNFTVFYACFFFGHNTPPIIDRIK